MIRTHALVPFLLSGLLVSCGEKTAEATAVRRPRTEAEFLSALAEATRSGGSHGEKALVHPSTFQNIDKQQQEFLNECFSRDANRAIPETYRATTTAIPPEAPLPFEGAFVYPVRPTTSLQIDFDDPAGGSVSMIRTVAVDDDGVWWLVVPVPTDETLARMEKSRAERETNKRRAKDLLRNIREPVREELTTLLREGRKITAVKRYREVSGEGLRVAKSVIDALADEVRSAPQNERP